MCACVRMDLTREVLTEDGRQCDDACVGVRAEVACSVLSHMLFKYAGWSQKFA
jgi:hypothetical protein